MRAQMLPAVLAAAFVGFGQAAQGQTQKPLPAAQPQPPAKAAAAQTAAPAKTADQQIVVPAETTIPLSLSNTINTKTAAEGDGVYCETIYPITVGNRIVIPANSYVRGTLTRVVRPGHMRGKAELRMRFDSLTLPNGTTRSLRAVISGFNGSGNEGFNREEPAIKGQSSKGADAGKIAESTITGAEIGTIAGAAGHNVGKGLGIGSAIGAAGGLVWVLATRGKEIVLPQGTNFEVKLLTPLKFYDDEIDPPSRYDNGPALPSRNPGPGR